MTKKRIIITDAKKYQLTSKKTEILNLLLVDGKILGFGYLPDDETANHLNCKGHFIIPNTYNLASCFSPVKVQSSVFSIKQLPKLDIDALKNIDSRCNKFIISHQYPYQKLTKKQAVFLQNKKVPLIVISSISEAMYMLQESKSSIPVHIILKEITSELINHISKSCIQNISFGLFVEDLPYIKKNLIIELLESQKILSISSRSDNSYFDSLCAFFGDDSLYVMSLLFEEYAKKIFKFNMPSLKLFNSPSFNIINPKNKHCSTHIFRNGKSSNN